MQRRPRRDRKIRRATILAQQVRAQGNARFSLAPTGAKARVALERLEIIVPALNCLLELVQGYVFTAAYENFAHASARQCAASPRNSIASYAGLGRSQLGTRVSAARRLAAAAQNGAR